MLLGVVGSRKRDAASDKALIREFIREKLSEGEEVILVSGGCPDGADRFAEELTVEFGFPEMVIHEPDETMLPPAGQRKTWHYTKMYYARNTLIAEDCDELLALPSETRGGTDDTIDKARKLGKTIHIR